MFGINSNFCEVYFNLLKQNLNFRKTLLKITIFSKEQYGFRCFIPNVMKAMKSQDDFHLVLSLLIIIDSQIRCTFMLIVIGRLDSLIIFIIQLSLPLPFRSSFFHSGKSRI